MNTRDEKKNKKPKESRASTDNSPPPLNPTSHNMANEGSSPTNYSEKANSRYKSLYINSQKKIEALTQENWQLAKKLENAIGKVDVYEKMINELSQMYDKMKDGILVPNMERAAETTPNHLLSQTPITDAQLAAAMRERKRKKKGA
ncbi:uncharacterized protein LOC131144642 isoform X2 [Malania oleifera]|uniref:uncharacterized protein LOC131144642 isoform X2 n=1 Tax=Malania oleifera TaxID=397392 RepID=UPI0025AE406A|nr:uncharacterized protein LOC131144642 isoform X2 [Malania oleifera]